MFKEEQLKSLSDDSLTFVQLRGTSKIQNTAVYQYLTKRGKKVIFYFHISKKEDGFQISLESTNVTKETKLRGSIVAHQIKELIESSPSFRIRKTTGTHEIKFGYGIEKDLEQYKENLKRKRSATLKKSEVLALKDEILSFYNEAKNLELIEENDYSPYYEGNVLLLSGREGRYLVDLLEEMNLASWGKWSNNYHLKINYKDFKSTGKKMMYHFERFFEKKGFRIWIHTWYD